MRNRWTVLCVLCLAVLLIVIDNTIVNVALPSLSKDLHASNSGLQWVVDGYSLPFAGFLLAGAGAAERYGRKKVLLAGLVAFGAFSMMAAWSTTLDQLLASRALMGVAAAFIFPATLSILSVTFTDSKERAIAFGAWGATAGVAVAIGPIAGGWLLSNYWFGSIFLINGPLAVVTLTLIYLVITESKIARTDRIDLLGLILGTITVGMLTYNIIEAPNWGWASGRFLAMAFLNVVVGWAFAAFELRHQNPLIDLRIFKSRYFSSGALAIALNFFSLFGFIFLITQYFQLVRGYSPLSAGVHTLPFAGGVVVVSPIGTLVAERIGARKVVPIGFVFTSIAMFWMATLSPQAAYVGPVLGSMLLLSTGFALVNSPSTNSLMDTLESRNLGAGAAVNETTRELGGTLGVAVVGSVFASIFSPKIESLLHPALAHGLTLSELKLAQSSTQAARVVVEHFPLNLRVHFQQLVTNAFSDALHAACWSIGVTTSIVAIVLWLMTPAKSN